MGVASRTLEITVISGENIHVTEDVYVVVRGESLNCYTTKTAKDNRCVNNSSFLSWNEKFLLDVPLHGRSITFEVQCKKFKSVRPIGVARIAVVDLLNNDESKMCMPFFSYRLRDWEGRQNGVINFCVKEVEKRSIDLPEKNCVDRLTGMDVAIGIPV